jgi:hypothetical protein
MRNTIFAGFTLIAMGASDGFAAVPDTLVASAGVQIQAPAEAAPLAAPAAAFQQDQQDRYEQDRYDQDRYQDRYGRLDVRVWMDSDRDVFRPGERSRVMVRTTGDAYLAVINIDPRGDVEFLWPRSGYDDGYVEGGRTLDVGSRGSRYLSVGGVYGMGYVFAIASEEPLDLQRVRDYYSRRTVGFDRRLNVYGDPFYAMERFERLLVDDRDYGYHARDHYSYHVGNSRYRYPRYACHDGYGAWYANSASYYSDCDYVRVLLRERPYYYDTRYWRGDRSTYYRRHYRDDGYDRREPEHGYKDGRGGRSSAAGVTSTTRPPARRLDARPLARSGSDLFQLQQDQEGTKQQEPRTTRPRPTLQRRPPESEPVRRAEPRDRNDEPKTREAPPRERVRDEPRVRETPRQREPQRESPPPRRVEPRETPRVRESQPRNDPPSSRGGSERSTPSERSAPRARPSKEG